MSDIPARARIAVTAIAAAVVYGVLHDQVTARVCVERFTIGHPPVFGTSDPTLLGLGWGVIATWWVGRALGVALALVARVGSWPRTAPSELHRPIAVLLLCNGACAIVAGVRGVVWLVEPLASRVPRERHVAFLADAWAHGASYAVGFAGGLVVLALTARARRRGATAG